MNKRKRKLFISIVLLVIWMAFIFFMSDMSTNTSNDKSKDIVNGIIDKVDKISNANDDIVKKHQSIKYVDEINFLFRKFMHATVYFALAILVFNLLIQVMKKKIHVYNIWTIVICFLYACTDEYHQTFVMGRNGQCIDVLIDIVGAVLGCVIINIVYKMVKKYYGKKIYE